MTHALSAEAGILQHSPQKRAGISEAKCGPIRPTNQQETVCATAFQASLTTY